MEERADDPGARGSEDPMPGSVVEEDGLSQEKATEEKESEGEEEGRDARKPRTAKKVSHAEKGPARADAHSFPIMVPILREGTTQKQCAPGEDQGGERRRARKSGQVRD